MEERLAGEFGARHEEGLREILAKSSRLMAREGFHGTSMRDIARETGRSLAGLYHYFRCKEDLLFLINYHGFVALNDAWQQMARRFDTPEGRLFAFIYLHTHYYVANIDEVRVMNRGTQELEYGRAREIRKLKDRHTADARRIVRELHSAATGSRIQPHRLERLTYLLFGMMNWIFGWYSSETHGGVDELIRDIYVTFVHGIAGAGADTGLLDHYQATAREAFAGNGSTHWGRLGRAA